MQAESEADLTTIREQERSKKSRKSKKVGNLQILPVRVGLPVLAVGSEVALLYLVQVQK